MEECCQTHRPSSTTWQKIRAILTQNQGYFHKILGVKLGSKGVFFLFFFQAKLYTHKQAISAFCI